MDPLRLCFALGPIAVYLLLFGSLNLSKRPFLVSGARDLAALALAISGTVVVGPVELFFPETAAVTFGPYVWLFLLSFYGLAVMLVLLLLRPRLVMYNVTSDQLRPLLGRMIDRLDHDARWAGDCVVAPGLGIQFYVDSVSTMRNITLKAAGSRQDHLGWRRLEQALRAELSEVAGTPNPRGVLLISTGTMIMLGLVLAVGHDPQGVANSLLQLLHLEDWLPVS